MPVSTSVRKALFAGVAALAFGGGLYWKLAPGTVAPAPPDPATTPLAKLPLDQLGPLDPDDRATLEAAEALFRQDRPADALKRLSVFRHQDGGPAHLRGALLTGRCLLALGSYPEAEQAFRYVADARPDEPDAHRGLAVVYEFLGSSGKEEAHLKRVAELDPGDYRALTGLAASYLDMKDYGPAEEALREALRRNPPADVAAGLRRDLAEALLGLKRYDEALAADPADDTPAGRAVRAECLRMLNRPADAAREVDTALAANPTDAKVRGRLLTERGSLLVDRRDDAAAAAAFEQALAADEHNLTARFQFSLTLRRLGRAAQADAEEAKFKDSEARVKRVADLTKRAIEQPWDPAVRRDLADACRGLNLTDMAAHWQRAAAVCEARR